MLGKSRESAYSSIDCRPTNMWERKIENNEDKNKKENSVKILQEVNHT